MKSMKRAQGLFDRILDRDNLRLAASKAMRGKRHRPEVIRFAQDAERQLADLAASVRDGSLPLGRFHQFIIHDPKERIITAPIFIERVLHHAIMNVCEPVFERWLIADTFACRRGLGRDRAIDRARQFACRHRFYLKLDIRKYFDSIDHAILLQRLARLFKDRPLLDLFARIIGSFRSEAGSGLPIGSLTSQHFANFYLGQLDRFVKETRRVRGYVRYMDDMALWSDSKESLRGDLAAMTEFLKAELRLEWKPTPFLNRTSQGMDFLGFRVHPTHVTLNSRSKLRYRRQVRNVINLGRRGRLDPTAMQARLVAMTAFARTAGVSSWRFRDRFLTSLVEIDPEAPTASTAAAVGTTTP
jgi:hypothetical protein